MLVAAALIGIAAVGLRLLVKRKRFHFKCNRIEIVFEVVLI